MATPKTVWGIDIGQVALKALKLRGVEGDLQVEAFDIIEHPKILSQPDVDRNGIIRSALEQFLSRNTLVGSTVVISVPGQSSFTRFVKLPPVDPSKIPDIVRYEAEQQIPFPIADVIWRWQTFQEKDTPDIELGIFAMKRVDVGDVLNHFVQVELPVDVVQMAPLALYNFMTFDEQVEAGGATLLADVGADKTDLVVSDGSRLWTRTIQIGGNNFTEALVRAFKLSFSKAEKLKRTAATSKYARQIFQAMRPVFADLVQEIQRSVGYYTSLHREARFKKLIGLGNGFRLPGLQKFLEQNLNMPVARIDSYNKIQPSGSVNAPTFTENILSFAVSYGLAVQGMDLSTIKTNMLPQEVSRQRVWSTKRPWFAAAAAMILASLGAGVYGSLSTVSKLSSDNPDLVKAQEVATSLDRYRKDYQNIAGQVGQGEQAVVKSYQLLGYRDFWPSVMSMISRSLVEVATDQALLEQYASAADEAAQSGALKKLTAKPRDTRRIITVEKIQTQYFSDVFNKATVGLVRGSTPAVAPPVNRTRKDGFKIILTGRTPLSKDRVHNELIRPLLTHSADIAKNAKVFSLVDYAVTEYPPLDPSLLTGSRAPVATSAAPGAPALRYPDPLIPTEDQVNDTRFTICWVIAIEGDGVRVPTASTGTEP